LVLDDASPGVLARRLIKMSVNGKIKGVLYGHDLKIEKRFKNEPFF
jgi:hypothetical protein